MGDYRGVIATCYASTINLLLARRMKTHHLIAILTTFGCTLLPAQEPFVFQITNDQVEDIEPSVYQETVSWSRFDGNDYEIFFWDGDQITQITDNDYDDVGSDTYGGHVVWVSKVPTGVTINGNPQTADEIRAYYQGGRFFGRRFRIREL